MKTLRRSIALMLTLFCFNCTSDDDPGLYIFSETYDFSQNQHGWEADFTDYPTSLTALADTIYEWKAEYTDLPVYLGGSKAMKLSSNNASGDVFMFIKKKLTGFQPNTTYTLVFEVDVASNAMAGQGVVLKAGASAAEPKKVIENNFTYSLNLDKGEPLTSGEDLILLGDIGAFAEGNEFALTTKSNANGYDKLIIRTSDEGEIWLIVGTDSTFRGKTTVYYKKVSVIFSVLN